MMTRITAICMMALLLLTGCGTLPADSKPSVLPDPTSTPAATQEPIKQTEETTPAPTPTMEPKKPVNPLDSFSEDDQKIINEKFTFTGTPPADKKIADGKAKDGFYVVEEPPTSYGHKPYVGLTITGGQVIEVIFFQYNPETKTYKDENYGKEYGTQFGEDTFEKAQISVEGGRQYPVKLIETQDLGEVDAVSGATYNYELFKMGVNDALKQGMK